MHPFLPHIHAQQGRGIYLPVPANGHTFKNAIGGAGNDVVKFIGHATRAGHVSHAARPIELGGQDVVQHASGISDLETAWLDSSNLETNANVFLVKGIHS